MSGRLSYGSRRKYTHMVGDDVDVWNRFIVKFPDRFETVDYDFRVGDGQQLDIELGENYQRMAKMLSQLRIDALCWNGELPTIVEVKPRCVITALGQLQGYKILFVKEFKNIISPELLMVCEVISNDVLHVFKESRISVEIV